MAGSGTSNTRVITPLDGSNYPTWKIQCQMGLMKDGLWGIVNESETRPGADDADGIERFDKKWDKALAIIVLSIDPTLLYMIGDPTSPVDVWKKLRDQFQRKTWANKLRLRRKLYSLKLSDDARIQQELPVEIPPPPIPRIFYNRVPKCGSSTMMDLITEMGRAHNFTFIRDGVFMTFYMEEPWKRQFAQRMFTFSTPMVYERHFHFIDFEDYNLSPRPVYINLVRDPLDRLVSWYYFRRFQEGHIRDMPTAKKYRTYDECVLGNHSECAYPGGDRAEEGYFKLIPFFCGQEAFCREPSEKSLSQAIHNIKQYYTVVGYIEEYHAFMQVLQYTLPSYFRGAPEVFKALSEAWKRNHRTTYKLPISEEVAQIMYGKLKHEYELYHFIQKRFNSIFNAIVSAEKKFRK